MTSFFFAESKEKTAKKANEKREKFRPTVENVWQLLRDNWLSNQSYNDILEHCCHAWNKLVDMPWKIMSIGLRDWAHRLSNAPESAAFWNREYVGSPTQNLNSN